jgi:hypothetical protein
MRNSRRFIFTPRGWFDRLFLPIYISGDAICCEQHHDDDYDPGQPGAVIVSSQLDAINPPGPEPGGFVLASLQAEYATLNEMKRRGESWQW